VKQIKDLDKNLFRGYFQRSLKEMGKFIYQLNDPEVYGKLPEQRLLKKRKNPFTKFGPQDRFLHDSEVEVDPDSIEKPE